MAKRVIRTDEDPLLRKKSREVTKFDDRLKELIQDMFETMDEAPGVGLAAPQVGILKRVIVIDDREEVNRKRMYMINPVITHKEGKAVDLEGCLSVPLKQGTVERATNIDVEYMDIDGNKKSLNATDFFARIIQHEVDHLDGILFTDKAIDIYLPEEG
ncbi:peptide deformylase [Peptoniphilus sp.]|jgi:peptide deformylase|uniref:peptide deformylase n=1 Tax=Peptoniphilus sp. TaxID=1971214 RepID=UPI003D8CD4D3